jgi:hypothetical protein
MFLAAALYWSRDGMSLPKYSYYQEEKITVTTETTTILPQDVCDRAIFECTRTVFCLYR